MKKKITIQIADPAGNITAFVMDSVSSEDYIPIAKAIMALPDRGIEQVGYITETWPFGVPHMEMMGGEFCGNATRSFGYLVAKKNKKLPTKVDVTVSGAVGILEVEIDYQNESSRTAMPMPQGIKKIETGKEAVFDAVIFDGIAHLIVPGKKRSEAFVQNTLKIMSQIFDSDALGIMFLEKNKMTPVVWVRQTDSIIWESSCGSGSLACGIYKCHNAVDGVYTQIFHQPGGSVEAVITIKDKAVTNCSIGGPIRLMDKEVIEITLD